MLADNTLYLHSSMGQVPAKPRLDSICEPSTGGRTSRHPRHAYRRASSFSGSHRSDLTMTCCAKLRVVLVSLAIIVGSVTAAGLIGYFLSLLDFSGDGAWNVIGNFTVKQLEIVLRLSPGERTLTGTMRTQMVMDKVSTRCSQHEESSSFDGQADATGALCLKWSMSNEDVKKSSSSKKDEYYSKDHKDYSLRSEAEIEAEAAAEEATAVYLRVVEEVLEGELNHTTCYHLHWLTANLDYELEDCYDVQPAALTSSTRESYHRYWYGGAQMFNQTWGIEDLSLDMMPFITNDIFASQYGNVMEAYWLSSDNFAIIASPHIPLSVSLNGKHQPGKFCLRSKFTQTPYDQYRDKHQRLQLKYSVCRGSLDFLKYLHLGVINRFYSLPRGIPDERMFRHPIWSTWAQYKSLINQTQVLNFARDIRNNGFSDSQLEIDDKWAAHHGDFAFASDKFPEPADMVSQLNDMGFRTTVWTHPFANLDSVNFVEGSDHGYWVSIPDTGVNQGYVNVPAITRWWNGAGVLLDTTSYQARRWFVEKAKEFLHTYNIDSFKFDAGETYFMPKYGRLSNASHPNQLTKDFIEMVAEFGDLIEVRVVSQTQHLPIFVRIMDKDSRWGYDNGLKSLIPNALLFGLLGYPFLLPDMIGGNAYGDAGLFSFDYPPAELFIRWAEANALLPALQFSITPWQYTSEEAHGDLVLPITRRMVELHDQMSQDMVSLAREATRSGAPIIRPLWWLESSDEAFRLDSQFLVGSDVLVAPVLEPGHTSRDVYLPRGRWRDQNNQTLEHQGPTWLMTYHAPLGTLPHFKRVDTA